MVKRNKMHVVIHYLKLMDRIPKPVFSKGVFIFDPLMSDLS